jgi:hypothetical protein
VNPVQREALRLAEGLPATPKNILRVAMVTSPDAARWAFQQWELRRRSVAKFALGREMLFDRDGLEMATHEEVAAYHASCFPEGEAIQDLTCGIGGDLIAFARGGEAIGYDLDRARAAYSIHNLDVHGLSAEIMVSDSVSSGGYDFAFCDPSRRGPSGRTLRIAEFAPNPEVVAGYFREAQLGGIKLSPMLADKDLERLGGRLEFVSYGGECREALIWLGSMVTTTARSAVHVESRQVLLAGSDPTVVSSPLGFLYGADPAAIRAHCLGTLCLEFALSGLGESNGYLTGDQLVGSPWLDAFEVLAWHSADVRRTQSELKRLGGGTPVIKSRGAAVDVHKLRKELRGEGEELVVVVYPDGRSLKHVICRRLV